MPLNVTKGSVYTRSMALHRKLEHGCVITSRSSIVNRIAYLCPDWHSLATKLIPKKCNKHTAYAIVYSSFKCERNGLPIWTLLKCAVRQWLSYELLWSKVTTLIHRGRGHPEKTSTEVIGMGCLPLGLTGTYTSDRKAWSYRQRSAVRLEPAPLR